MMMEALRICDSSKIRPNFVTRFIKYILMLCFIRMRSAFVLTKANEKVKLY